MDPKSIHIDDSWKLPLWKYFGDEKFDKIVHFIKSEKAAGKTIYPSGRFIFKAFDDTPFDKVKVVIIGQDPYHNPDEAMGLCFSVPKGIRVPPSLKNIYKEMASDINFSIPNHGDLSSWAKQGVFLLNAILTVEHKKPASHRKIGWQEFTDFVIKTISDKKDNVVFLLWGNFAKGKKTLIDTQKHLVLESAHPSPLAGKAFFDNMHFSQTNAYLEKHGKAKINWELS